MVSTEKVKKGNITGLKDRQNKSALGISTVFLDIWILPLFPFPLLLNRSNRHIDIYGSLIKGPSRHLLCLYSTSVHEVTADSALSSLFESLTDEYSFTHMSSTPPHLLL